LSQADSPYAAAFARDGFVLGGPVLDPAELARLRQDSDAFADEAAIRRSSGSALEGEESGSSPTFLFMGDESRPHYNVTDAKGSSSAFRSVTQNGAILQIAADILDARTIHVWSDALQYKPPIEGGAINWHQDGLYHALYGVDVPVDRVLSAWVAIDDADEETGCMWMVPGSHRWGEQNHHLDRFAGLKERNELAAVEPPADVDSTQWRQPVACPVRAGEVHFHHAHTWHASPSNRSVKARRAYTIFYLADASGALTSLPLVYSRQ
jgi:ectoine hydroxylase-related dioxygenase (phytanoyl-CoA dioxygenase family)